MASALEAAGWVFSADPTADEGTGNVYGTNSVLRNLANDLSQDGAPSLALDSGGVPFQAWYKVEPPSAGIGSRVYVADYNGTGWNDPVIIPNSFGFDSYVNATTDRLGHRLVVFVYSDTSSLTWDLTGDQFMAALTASDVYYSTFDGSSWSAPQPVATTPGADSDLQLSRLANGNVLAVWIYHDSSGTAYLLSSTWDGSAWTTPYEVVSGDIFQPTAQQADGITYLIWTQVVDEDNDRFGLFTSQNVGGVWSKPVAFAPPLLGSSVRPALAVEPKLPSLNLSALETVTDSEKTACCKCNKIKDEVLRHRQMRLRAGKL